MSTPVVETWICAVCGNDILKDGHRKDCYHMKPTEAEAELESKIGVKASNPKDLIGSNKLPMSLVPETTKAYLAIGHMEGHLKYGLVNWREAGVKMSIYLDAMERHISKMKGGEWEDPATKVPHLANAITCLSIIIDAYECGKLIDDRPQAAPVAKLIDRLADTVVHLKKLFGESKPVDYFLKGPKQRG